jgi:hypothetical protein
MTGIGLEKIIKGKLEDELILIATDPHQNLSFFFIV